MINILYTINFLTNGGPTRVLQNIVYSLDLQKYNVTILTIINENNSKIVEELREYGIKVIELNYNKKLKEILKYRKSIIDEINKVNPDIIHTHGIVTTFLVTNHKIRAKKITTIHNNMYEDYKYTYGKIKGFIINQLHINKLKRFDDVECCSETSYKILKRKLKNVGYIRNGINVKAYKENARENIRKELGIAKDDIVYVYGGYINRRKRVVELVNMFNTNLNKNEWLLIVGKGEEEKEARKITNNQIKFIGFKTNIIDYFCASDVYTSYSSSEGFSISIIEALSCGLLCFLSDISSHKECFEIDEDYYLGESFNYNDFSKKKKVLSEHLKKIDKEKIKEFQKKYLSAISMTKEYEKKYEQLYEKKGRNK